jgi:hypothetical protein
MPAAGPYNRPDQKKGLEPSEPASGPATIDLLFSFRGKEARPASRQAVRPEAPVFPGAGKQSRLSS